jgi:elongation factor G
VQEAFGATCVPAVLHDGSGPAFTTVTAALGTDDGVALTEQVVEADDALMERYLEGEKLSLDELGAAFGKAMIGGRVAPVFVVSAEKGIGVAELADAIVHTFPASDAARPPTATVLKGEDPVEVSIAADGPTCARVFKVVSDPYVGHICYLRVYGGTLDADSSLTNHRTQKDDRIPGYQRVQGKETKPLESVPPGDIVAVVKVESLHRDDTVYEGTECRLTGPPYPTPMVARAVEPKSRGDETKLGEAVTKLVEEDPTFRFRRDPFTKEQVISGLSELHLDVLLRRAHRRQKVELVTRLPKVAYRETIVGTHETRYRHKKQTGGAGQFAEVWLRVKPQERGAGFEFADVTVGGSIPKQFIPSCEKGIRKVLADGAVAGYPVVDVRAEVFDGKHHPVDSKDIAFQVAARNAFRECMRNAKPMLLEPIAKVEIMVPSRFMGDITSDLSGRRGRMQGMDSEGDVQIIKAEVPVAEMLSYSSELRSLTSGEGAYTMEESHYDIVPSNIAQGIIDAAAKDMKDDDD